MKKADLNVTGTFIWYYYICHRQVWLMSRRIVPEQDDPNIEIGRFIHEMSYPRHKKEINLGHIKIDIVMKGKDGFVVAEVKKTSKFITSARMQLAYYLIELEKLGLYTSGELRFPEEKRVEKIELTSQLRQELEEAVRDILRIAYLEKPPQPKKINFCRKCAYAEFCWS